MPPPWDIPRVAATVVAPLEISLHRLLSPSFCSVVIGLVVHAAIGSLCQSCGLAPLLPGCSGLRSFVELPFRSSESLRCSGEFDFFVDVDCRRAAVTACPAARRSCDELRRGLSFGDLPRDASFEPPLPRTADELPACPPWRGPP